MAFFLVGAVHMALMLLSLKVASTMVAGWSVFGLVPSKDRERFVDPVARTAAATVPVGMAPRAGVQTSLSPALAPRRVDLPALQPAPAANDTGLDSAVSRETRIVVKGGEGARVNPLNPPSTRTRGIGNRFRTAGSGRGAPGQPSPLPETYK